MMQRHLLCICVVGLSLTGCGRLKGLFSLGSAETQSDSTVEVLNLTQAEEAPFYFVWNQLTANETLILLRDQNALVREPATVPDHLRPSGLLDYLNFDLPSSEYQIQYNATTKKIDGSYLTDTPSAILSRIHDQFESNKVAFLKRYFTASRANALTRQTSITKPKGQANVQVMSWASTFENTPHIHTAAYLINSLTGPTKTHEQMKAALDALPSGAKVVRFWNFERVPKVVGSGVRWGYWDNDVVNGAFDGKPTIYTDSWRAYLEPVWDAWWKRYKEIGGKVDFVMFDLEEDNPIWEAMYGDATHVQMILGDPRIETVKKEMGWNISSFAEIQSVRSNFSRDPRAFLFGAWMHRRTGRDLQFLLDIAKRYFPDVQGSDYDHTSAATSTYPASASYSQHYINLGADYTVGSHGAFSLYGELRHIWDWRLPTPAHVEAPVATFPNYPMPPTLPAEWDAFTFTMAGLRSAQASRFAPLMSWLSYKDFNNPAEAGELGSKQSALLYQSDYWTEIVFHALLTGAQPAYWNGNGLHNDMPLEAAVTEAEAVIHYEGLRPMVDGPIEWGQPYIATRADVGGRILWRVTVSSSVQATITEGSRLTFDFSDGSQLTIPKGVIETAPSVSSVGYWVSQPR